MHKVLLNILHTHTYTCCDANAHFKRMKTPMWHANAKPYSQHERMMEVYVSGEPGTDTGTHIPTQTDNDRNRQTQTDMHMHVDSQTKQYVHRVAFANLWGGVYM